MREIGSRREYEIRTFSIDVKEISLHLLLFNQSRTGSKRIPVHPESSSSIPSENLEIRIDGEIDCGVSSGSVRFLRIEVDDVLLTSVEPLSWSAQSTGNESRSAKRTLCERRRTLS